VNAAIRRALAEPPDVRVRAAPRAVPRWREYALAAGVALAMTAGLAVWLLRPSDTLAREVVAHVEGEPDSWLSSHGVSAGEIGHALQRSGIGLDLASDRIVYAQSCWFRGHYVPHLVVQTAQGPATVLILRNQRVNARQTFHEAGMSGVIVPAPQGSLAVLTRGGANVETLAMQMQQDVRWLPDAQ
jgi:hypothetical protein